jgi:hypothetical protein
VSIDPRRGHLHRLSRQFELRIIPALEGVDAIVYSLVALVFLVAAFGMLGYSVVAFPENVAINSFPLAIIAAISATRRILAIGAQMSIAGDHLSADKFQQAMIDLSVNAGAILAISIALYLLGRREPRDAVP